MLDEQFFGDSRFHSYLSENFILFHAENTEGKGLEQFLAYRVQGTPSVIFLTPDGQEIDRLVGYGSDPDAYLTLIKTMMTSETTLLALKQAFEQNQQDYQVIGQLIRKYVLRRDLDSGQEYLTLALSNPEAAKAAILPPDDFVEEPVSVYEFATYSISSTSLEALESFLAEYPESSLRDRALGNITRFLLTEETNEAAYLAYARLKRQYPLSKALHSAFLRYGERSGKHLDEALACGDFLCGEPENVDNLHYHRLYCQLLMANDRRDQALLVFGHDYAQLHWDDANLLNAYAWHWAVRAENLESAEAAAQRSLELEENDGTWDTMSMVYWKQGRLELALDAEERALEMAGGSNAGYEEQIAEIKKELVADRS